MTNTERDYLAAIRAAHSIGASGEVLDALVGLADVYIERGETQEGADVLAYVLRQAQAAPATRAHAQESWDTLETYICPRVLLDAADFASKAALSDLIEYVFA